MRPSRNAPKYKTLPNYVPGILIIISQLVGLISDANGAEQSLQNPKGFLIGGMVIWLCCIYYATNGSRYSSLAKLSTVFIPLLSVTLWSSIQIFQGEYSLTNIFTLIVEIIGIIVICIYIMFALQRGKQQRGFIGPNPFYPKFPVYPLIIRNTAKLILFSTIFGGSGILIYAIYLNIYTPQKIVVLITKFDGPDPLKYRVTETVIANLQDRLSNHDGITIKTLDRNITAGEGSQVAKQVGKEQKAAIVIWGWYGVTQSNVILDAHFELISIENKSPKQTFIVSEQTMHKFTLNEIDSYFIQCNLASEMAFLSLVNIGIARYQQSEFQEAINYFDEAFSLIETIRGSKFLQVATYRANSCFFLRKYDCALRDYSNMLKVLPNDTTYLENRAYIYMANKQIYSAIIDLDKIESIDPNNTRIIHAKSIAKYKVGDLDGALKDINRAISKDEQNVDLLAWRGSLYNSMGKNDLSVIELEKVIKSDPNNIEANYDISSVYLELGNGDLALKYINDSMKLKVVGESFAIRGDIYMLRGEYRKAIDDYNSALNFDNSVDSIGDSCKCNVYRGRGDAYSSLGITSTALQDYAKSIEANPRAWRTFRSRARLYTKIDNRSSAVKDWNSVIQFSTDPDVIKEAKDAIAKLQ